MLRMVKAQDEVSMPLGHYPKSRTSYGGGQDEISMPYSSYPMRTHTFYKGLKSETGLAFHLVAIQLDHVHPNGMGERMR
jgi:hypothetical protein